LGSSATALAAPYFVPARVFAQPPSDRVVHACIGTDGMGWSDVTSLATHPNIQIVALCDVDVDRMGQASEKYPQARRYQDWRELLESEADKIDSVNVSVPDHMHAPISMMAILRGKHVYCQKPLTHEVAEARALRLAAKRNQVVTQMGNQIQSADVYRTAVKAIQDGMIGGVKAIHAWTGAHFPQSGRPPGQDPIPASLDWDKWLGVAPVRPFKAGLYHTFNWRGWQDFGGGAIGDFGCHILDTPFKALGLTAPRTLRAEVPKEWADNPALNRECWPVWEIIHYEFPGSSQTTDSTLPVTWYDGGKQPARDLFGFSSANEPIPGSGALFLGEQANLLLPHVGAPRLLGGTKAAEAAIGHVDGFSHYHAFIDACLGQGETGSSFEFGGPLAEASLLGTIAVRFPGKTLEWDAENLKITNDEQANQFVARRYRKGWEIPELA
jgi:predicted dehydrogenase